MGHRACIRQQSSNVRWRSGESIHRGMHVDVDFGLPTEIDLVELHSSHDQRKIEVQLDLPAKLDKLEDPPAGDLRRPGYAKTVKARGIDYLFIDNPYRIAADIRQDPARWGMEFIADRGGNRLYRIQMNEYFLGVVGGQSRTTAVIGDHDGRIVGCGERGPVQSRGRRRSQSQISARDAGVHLPGCQPCWNRRHQFQIRLFLACAAGPPTKPSCFTN